MSNEHLSMDRRGFLKLAGGASVGLMYLWITGCESNSVDPIATGSVLPFLTPIDSFYYKNGAEISISRWSMPSIDSATWKLTIDGLVDTPINVTYQDIMNEIAARVDLLKTMRCVIDSNEVQGLIGTAIWSGVPLRTFLDRAGIDRTRTKRLRLYGDDGFTNNIVLDRIYNPDDPALVEPLLVTHINGQPLPPEHGFPVRLIIHESFGYKNVKWLTRVEATAADTPFGTYQDKGFADDGVIRVVSRVTDPVDNLTVTAGQIRCTGFAVSGFGGIAAIEYSLDGGPFQQAAIDTISQVMAEVPDLATTVQGADPSTYSYPYRGVWVKWGCQIDLAPGSHTLRIRASDTSGNVQPETDSDLSDGINSVPTVHLRAV